MGYPLASLIQTPDATTVRGQLLSALKGLGYVRRTVGVCPGLVSLSGTVSSAAACQVKISTTGSATTCQVQVSTDGGATFGAAVTPTPSGSSGTVAIGSTGVTLTLTNGPAGTTSGSDFVAGAIFAFDLTVPVLPVTAWQPGSTALTLVEVFAAALADVLQVVLGVASGGLVPYSSGLWLDLLAGGFYGLTRRAAQTAQHQVLFTAAAGAGPYTLTPGQLVVTTAGGLIFSNSSSVTIPAGGTVTATMVAESPGARYDVGLGAIAILVTSLPGVSCINTNVGDGTSLLVTGSDAESDHDLQARCQAKWPALGLGGTVPTYDLMAKAASSSVTRTLASPSSTTPGQVDVLLAGAAGPVSAGVVSAVQTYLTSRVPLCIIPNAVSATANVVNFAGTVYCARGTSAQVQAQVSNNLISLIGSTPIGGTLYQSQAVDALQSVPGVRNVALSSPSADVSLAGGYVATLGTTSGLSFVEV